MSRKRAYEDGDRHSGGCRDHQGGAAAIRALKGAKADRYGADRTERAHRRLSQHEPDDQRNRDANRTAQRGRPLELGPIDSNCWRENLMDGRGTVDHGSYSVSSFQSPVSTETGGWIRRSELAPGNWRLGWKPETVCWRQADLELEPVAVSWKREAVFNASYTTSLASRPEAHR